MSEPYPGKSPRHVHEQIELRPSVAFVALVTGREVGKQALDLDARQPAQELRQRQQLLRRHAEPV